MNTETMTHLPLLFVRSERGPVTPRFTHITSIQKNKGKYAKRIGKKQPKKYLTFVCGKLWNRSK